jgi:protein-histidine pros-kinase
LINDLLDLAKIESGKVELALEAVNCHLLLEEVAATLRPLALAKGLSFELQLPPEEVTLTADRRALSQIIINLCNNAIKFTEQGKVCLMLDQQHDAGHQWTEIRVVDSGIGIRPEEQARLFQAFIQVEGAKSRREGTGLGLYLSQKLAGLLGGQITFESVFGKGSIFTLRMKPNGMDLRKP